MKIVFFGKGERGRACLDMLLKSRHEVSLIVAHFGESMDAEPVINRIAAAHRIRSIEPEDPNEASIVELLVRQAADVFVLAGYGRILKSRAIAAARRMCINLHGGKLPQYRGSSPMNWALINGETSFTLSIIRVDQGIDTGDILLERSFPIGLSDTICDLHEIALQQFPPMLTDVLDAVEAGRCIGKPQDPADAAYYPLRFPDDGFIVWDMLTAQQIHNRIRALTEPYPCATTMFRGRTVKLVASRLVDPPFHGEPGRVYRTSGRELLVAASDRCLRITRAVFADDGGDLADEIDRYDCLPTMREFVRRASEAHAWSSAP